MVTTNYTIDQNNWKSLEKVKDKKEFIPTPKYHFFVPSTTREKIQGIFNTIMAYGLGIAAALKLGSYIPSIAAAQTSLMNAVLKLASPFPLFQNPIVVRVLTFAPKVFAFIALMVVIRKIATIAVCSIAYPSASGLFHSDPTRYFEGFEECTKEKIKFCYFSIHKEGIEYKAYAAMKQFSESSTPWVLVGGGNCESADNSFIQKAAFFHERGFNVLYVDRVGIDRWPTIYRMGSGLEVGLQFLETVVNAKKILLYGFSLGGARMAKMISEHDFKKDRKYMVWSDLTFDRLSHFAAHIASTFVGSILSFKLVGPILSLLGIELDGVAAAKSLQTLKIPHIITQSFEYRETVLDDDSIREEKKPCDDGTIPGEVSLFAALKKENIADTKLTQCYGSKQVRHDKELPPYVQEKVDNALEEFREA